MRIFSRYCYKSYFKYRGWKQIAQWFAIGVTSIVMLGSFAVCDAYAAAQTTDIEGVTTAVGTPDEKELDFDVDPGTGTFDQYAARLYYSGTRDSQGDPYDFELRGWVWNDNFGWISLYCGADGKNLGINCGNRQYGVKVDLQNEGRMYGWAWGDNIGWVSFNCEVGKNETFTCGSSITEYGSYLNIEVDTGLGEVDAQDIAREPMAWSDTVGKFALTGIGSSILDIMVREGDAEAPYGIWTKVENRNGGDRNTPPTKENMPAADGLQGYDLYVNVADILGNPIDPLFVNFNTEWDNRVQKDQTINDTSPGNLISIIETAWGTSGPATSGGVTTAYHQRVSSVAPTKEGNCYDPDNDGCDVYYTKFAEETIQDQVLEYLGGSVTVTVPAVGSVTVDPLPFVGSTISNLEFAAPVDIDKVKYLLPGNPPEEIGVIQSTRNTIDTFKINASLKGASLGHNIKLELNTLEPDVVYNFIDNIDQSPAGGLNFKDLTVAAINALSNNELFAIPFAPNPDPEGLESYIAGAELRSTVTIPAFGVKYFNNGLPLTDDSEIINQAVEIISGSVFSPGAIKASSEADVTLYGDVAVYETRDRVLKDVTSLIKGITIPSVGTITINDATSESELQRNKLKDGRVYFFENTDVHLESVDVLHNFAPSTKDPISIILRGGDLYIDGNINGASVSGPVGLIALESNTDTNEDTKGGHIYVNANVTDMVEVSIFADGPMYRYVPGICFNSTDGLREPNFVDGSYGCPAFREPISSLPNQMYIKGNIATMNCIGCSVSTAPTRGNGTLISGGATAKNFAIARLYDFNYFSYFRLHPETGTPSGATAINVPASAKPNMPVYVEYSPAPSNMFGFRSY